MNQLSRSVRLVALLVACALTACSGTHSTLPNAPSKQGEARVTLSIKVPKASQATARRPSYISIGTATVNVTITDVKGNATTSTFPCNSDTCSGTVDAPIGNDVFNISLVDSNGALLSQGQAAATIAPDTANAVNVEFEGVVKSVTLSSIQGITPGTPTTIAVTVTAKDADNWLIIGHQPYRSPIALTLSDPSNTLTLSATQLASPADQLEVRYNGGTTFSSATISAALPDNGVNITPLVLKAAPAGSITSLPGYREVRLPDPSGNLGIESMTGGPDGRLWAYGDTPSEQNLYAIDPSNGATSVYTAPGMTLTAMAPVGPSEIAGVDNRAGMLDVFSTSGALVKQYPFPNTGGPTITYTAVIAPPDGNIYVEAGYSFAQLVPGSGLWTQYAVPSSLGCAMSLSGVHWAAGSDGNLYTVCTGTTLVSFNVATHAFTAITDTNGANVVIGNLPADGPSLIVGTDGNWYTSGTTYDSTTNTPVSPAIAYMPQGGGAASAIVVPSTIVGLSSVLQSAPGQLVLLSQGPNDLDGVVTFVNESTHSFGASFDDPVSGSTAMFGSYTAALTGPSGQPAGVAFSETTDTIGIYVPGD